uniref:Uncharacterized protein n=1 Tax=Candidatus Kentrum sp. TUN TaxID=2126343 RepID=A0A450ZTX1_9GAMM|nr:MAG: hypothetical protein BECKTUN1418F_GA0071002_110711 [Candidatus Kentron sp. TUN]VFK65211.1 MAG: hypothetical protein BECKTUN1418E_GA0071001_110310 [Candidatus Kentron sp. TUN]
MQLQNGDNSLVLHPTVGGALLYNDVNKISYYMNYGGVCILPSNSGYVVTASPAFPDAVKSLQYFTGSDELLPTISFGSGVCQQSCPVMFTIIYKLFVP